MRLGFSSMALEKQCLFDVEKVSDTDAYIEIFLNWVQKSLEFGEANEFDFVELILEGPIVDNDESFSRLRDVLDGFTIPFNFHAPFINNNIIDMDAYLREGSILEYERTIQFAAALARPPRNVTIHPGKVQAFLMQVLGPMTGVYFQAAVQRLAGISWPASMNVCFENMPARISHFFGSIEEIEKWSTSPGFETFKMTLDTSHLWICEGMEGFVPFFEKFSPLVTNVHLVDNVSNDNDPHTPVGNGVIDFPAIIAYLKDAGFDGDLVIEHPGPDEILHSRELLRTWLQDIF
jgi:sugar phosphate isomerase/epimerase